ncbi:MAG: sigma-54 dependent transcriptional regulator [Pseudomonadota bacterium]
MTDMIAHILIVDDDESMRMACVQLLEGEGFRTKTAASGADALEMTARESFDLVVLDLMMPGCSGADLMRALRQHCPSARFVIITGYGTVDSAVQMMREGAFDFLQKPFAPEALLGSVRDALVSRLQDLEDDCVQVALDEEVVSGKVIGASAAMGRVIDRARKVASTGSTALILGETGAGKEVIARLIHALGPRRGQPFVAVDCGALVEDLFESEMFGHLRGSFSGAFQTTVGKFEMAHRGTLLLDEISNLSLTSQARLLRVLQEREFYKVGSATRTAVDVHLLAASNRDLADAVSQGRFRQDLFYRLNVLDVRIPPLREHPEDIGPLATHFLKELDARRRGIHGFSRDAIEILTRYPWPGNVRELKNIVERALAICEGDRIRSKDLSGLQAPPSGLGDPAPGGSLAEMERLQIIQALERFGGHRERTAQFLGINRKTLREKIRRYAIDVTSM